jgi:hypothetical protein
MGSWPEYVDRAFRAVYYGGDEEREIEAFAQRWQGVEPEAFTRAFEQGTPQEKALALFVLSYSNNPNAQALLYRALESVEPMEQWASALCLGERKDEHALPVLLSCFQEFLPPRMHPLEREGGLYHSWRIRAASLLGEWGRKDLAPALRQALDTAWKLEQADIVDRKHVWHDYQDALLYALGQLEAFGALAGFSVPESRQWFWIVTLVCGSLQARSRYGDLLTEIQTNETLKEEIAQVLEQRFGAPAEKRATSIDSYAQTYFGRRAWVE